MVRSHQPQATFDRGGRQGGHVAEMQYRRLLSATVELAYEHGVQAITVATLCDRAGLSRRTFYERFDTREDCLLATFNDAIDQATQVVEQAMTGQQRWRDQTRIGLTALLCLFDREPAIGRLLIVEALGAGHQVLEARRHGIAQIISHIDQGCTETKTGRKPPLPPPLTAEGIVGAVFSVIHARMLEHPASLERPRSLERSPTVMKESHSGKHDQRALVELTGALMAMIIQPYLGAAAAQKELEQPITTPQQPVIPRLPSDPFKDLPLRFTYRTARVLASIADTPGASSKQVAIASGITDPGQISRLLTRLQHHNLIQDTGIGPAHGKPRAWTLTTRGQHILQATGQTQSVAT